ncbi:M56 family metallopeptidase [Stakelama marina]|uniref:Peptidase M56 domain-containing protein n=1 Tax=Stakelama marina TaxID=2826939 RepID=A0A8T4IDG6_9SPHN|nr:M56 family metallopeptidase [Stakelama marina]MBR0552132.1 hypothetical protein [Stakelama marina]
MIAWAIETAAATTIMMLLVLAIRKPVREAMGPRFAYLLWALPALRMILPPLPGNWRLSGLLAPAIDRANDGHVVMGLLNPASLPAGATDHALSTMSLGGATLAVVPPTASQGGAPVIALLIALWLVGAACFLGYHLIAHGRFCQRLIRGSRSTQAVADGRVQVLETDAATGPLAFGVLRKYVAFPRDFSERYDISERDLALAHELCHHQRGDLYANWAALVMLAFHWFNPVAWRAYRAFRADQEMACDAVVLAGRPQALRHAYGLAIVKSAHGGAVSAACHLNTINNLKGRLKMLSKNHRNSRRRLAAGVAGLAGLTVAALGVTASGTSAAETLRTNVEDATGVKLADLKLPHPPKAPAAPAAAAAPEAPAAPPAAQNDVPPPPPAPEAAPVPPAPPAPEAKVKERSYVWTSADGKKVHSYVFRGADGQRMADIPEVTEGNCGEGTETVKVITAPGNKDKARKMIVCTDRIERISKEAVARSVDAQKIAMEAVKTTHVALRSALEGLRTARASIASEPHLTDKERADALKDIDQEISNMRQEMSQGD